MSVAEMFAGGGVRDRGPPLRIQAVKIRAPDENLKLQKPPQ